MHKKLSRKITVQYKIESIFPLNAYPFIVSQIVQTGIDYNGRNNGPWNGRLYLCTKVILWTFTFIQSELGFVHIFVTNITKVIGQWRHEYGKVEFFLFQLIIHTDTDNHIGRSKESSNQFFTVSLITFNKLSLKLTGDSIVPIMCSLDT